MLPVLIGIFAFSQLMSNIEALRHEQNAGKQNIDTNVSIPYRQILRDMSQHKLRCLSLRPQHMAAMNFAAIIPKETIHG